MNTHHKAHGPSHRYRQNIAAVGIAIASLAWSGLAAGTSDAKPAGTYAQVKTFKTGFTTTARGIAVTPEGRIYAAGDQAVHIIGPSGDYASFPVPGEPACLAISKTGLIYLGIGDHVTIMDHCGTAKGQWAPTSSNSVVTSIAVGRESIWVADAGCREILRYAPDGTLAGRWGGSRPADTNSFVVPSAHFDVAEDATGRVWVVNPGRHRLEAHEADGNLLTSWGFFSHEDPAGFTGCCNPADFACAPNGSFVTADKGALARVRVFSAEGKLLATLADPQKLKAPQLARLGAGLDVATDAKGQIYVLDPVARTVLVFARKDQ
jgi:DNA-binding beta-propeller fold protein YncE